MGIPGSANPMLFGGAGAYQINQSLRFNSADSAYLNRTPATTTSRTTWTWSAWIKRGILTTDDRMVFSAATSLHSSNSTITYLGFNTSNQFVHYSINNGSLTWNRTTSQVFRDVSGWYHIVCVLDTSNATAGNRVRVYVNGTEVTAWATDTTPSQNAEGFVNLNTATHKVGQEAIRNRYSFDGYLAEVNFIDGTALTPSSFGETDTITGAWISKKYSGSYGTNGFYLNFSDNSGTTSTTLGKDSSGNGNNWTPNNFSVTAGAGNDSLIDTPTPYADGGNGRGNYATLNPLDRSSSSPTLSNGNLDIKTSTRTAQNESCRNTIGVSAGKWYFECIVTPVYSATFQAGEVGIKAVGTSLENRASNASDAFCFGVGGNGATWYKRNNSSFVSLTTSGATTGTVLSVAFDLDAGKIWVAKDGVWENSGNPASGTNAQFTSIASATYAAVVTPYSNDASNYTDFSLNFGQRAFAYTPPTGFKALNTANLPEPTIKKGSSYMDTVLYTGDNTARSITGLNFSPDFVWIKERSTSAGYHVLFDAVRGATKGLSSNATAAEITDSDSLTAFNSNGFSIGTGNTGWYVNRSSQTYVAWAWDANGAGSSNTAGTITSTVSANASAGFSIVTYTGTGANATVGHGLGVAPSMMIVKNRSAVAGWIVYHKFANASPATGGLRLNLTDAFVTYSLYWNNTEPNSSVFTLGSESQVNGNTNQMLAYCFSEVAGYSKFGSYTGNGSSDGPFVFCGFRPRWVMIKRTDSAANWQIYDTARDTTNRMFLELVPNSSAEENSVSLNIGVAIDALSNGFKLRDSDTAGNASGGTYIFAAFAELPFKYSNAR